MAVKEYFTYRDTGAGKEFIIVPKDYDTFPWRIESGGSYAVAPARVIGLSYADYLRFLMKMFPDDVIVRGKNHMYPIAYWKKNTAMYTFIKILNKKLDLALNPAKTIEERSANG